MPATGPDPGRAGASAPTDLRTRTAPPDDDWSAFLSRDEVLGGLPARRASTLLFAIESRTANLVALSRRAVARFGVERSAEEQEQAFLAAMAEGRDSPLQPSVQDLERYAPAWADLVPPDASLRAALARMVGQKYALPRGRMPGIAAALGLADAAVGERFLALHGAPIASVYADALPAGERWRWVRAAVSARLENLPPFWTAFTITLTETVGAGVLALPIAFAAVGPVAGVVALVVIGLVNIVTIAAMAEAVARSGAVRYRRAYLGRMVRDYLGPVGTAILTPALLLILVVIQLAYFIGLSTTLADAVGLPAPVWAALLGLVILFFLLRGGLGATVASALVVGTTSITLVVAMSLMALPHVSAANLRHAEVPFRNGQPFDRDLLELIFGVVLFAYFGHTTTASCAPVVLDRDPSGRSLIRGSMGGLAAALGLYGLWVVAVNGVVPAAALADVRGTALGPLAERVGPAVQVVGVVFAVLAMGMASIHVSLGLSYQVRDWLPAVGAGRSPWSRPGLRLAVGTAPMLAILAVVELLLLTDRASFAEPLGFLGAITAPIVAGVFSMLTLHASRRKGDAAVSGSWRVIGSPVVVVSVCVIFLGSIVVHGLFVWDDPLRRSIALLVALVVVGFAVATRRTAYVSRVVVDVQVGEGQTSEAATVAVVARGEAVPASVTWSPFEPGAGRTLQVEMPPLAVERLKVWVHRRTPTDLWEGVPAQVAVVDGDDRREMVLEPGSGQGIVSTDGRAPRVTISHLDGSAGTARR